MRGMQSRVEDGISFTGINSEYLVKFRPHTARSGQNLFMEFTCESAKQFLLSKLDEQASHDGIALDEIEKRMFLFSESSRGSDFETVEKFDKDYDAGAYEAKVTKLLRRSYARDKQTPNGKAFWKAALRMLSREDFYGLVMVDQASIPRTHEGLWKFLLGMLPLALVEICLLAVGSALIFVPSRFGLYLPDWFRLLLLPLFFGLFWYVGKIFGRVEPGKSAKQSESQRR